MKRFILLFILLIAASYAHSQYKVKFILEEKTAIHHDSIFITGTISNWDSTTNPSYLLKPLQATEKSITLILPAGTIRYKFHRGSWFTVEKSYDGQEVDDRIVTINKDTVLTDSVVSWRDETLADKKYSLLLPGPDSVKIATLTSIAHNYGFLTEYYNHDSALYYSEKALALLHGMKSSGKNRSISDASYYNQLIHLQHVIAALMYSMGNYSKALELGLDNLDIAGKLNDKIAMANNIEYIIGDYINMKDYSRALSYSKLMDSVMAMVKKGADDEVSALQFQARYQVANAYHKLKSEDSALFYAKTLFHYELSPQFSFYKYVWKGLLADIYNEKNVDDSAFFYYRQTIPFFKNTQTVPLQATQLAGLARLFRKTGRIDSALYHARMALDLLQDRKADIQSMGDNSNSYIIEISPLVAELYYANHQPDSAYKYLSLSQSLKDSLYNSDRVRQFQTLTFNDAVRQQQMEQQQTAAKKEYRTKIKMYGLVGVIAAVLVVAFILFRNNKHKQKANNLLQQEKEKVESTLSQLKSTQSQLIQSEKMASLGELTAGIAHEIQNPLNFVNNFSEVNTELIDELKTELASGNTKSANGIADDIKSNEEKINFHGKRADAIVKGMLQHSRSSSGKKELTDVNALCDEYLRLAYHGLRAKDKTFNAKFETDFDQSIVKINIIPQDIGRVILNLITNAFYAVSERKKQMAEGYEPVVSVATKKIADKIEVRIKDNGSGIPYHILDKIFQPFFTTKPTGQGTGLGLSLSYDIVKAHGGELKVETKEGEGSEFSIELPAG